MNKKLWITVVVPGTAVILSGTLLFPRSQAQAKAANLKKQAQFAQADPQDGGPGVGVPGAGPQGMGAPGMGGQRMGGPGMGGPNMGRPMAPPVMVATADYVYVLRGNTLYQFSAKDLKRLNTATLDADGPGLRRRLPRGPQAGGGPNPPQPGE